MARVTGSIKASNDNISQEDHPDAYKEKLENLKVKKSSSRGSLRSKKSTVSVQMEDVETGSMTQLKKFKS